MGQRCVRTRQSARIRACGGPDRRLVGSPTVPTISDVDQQAGRSRSVGGGCGHAAVVRTACADSRRRLGVNRIDGYLVHRSADIGRPGVAETRRALVKESAIGAFGASTYSPEELWMALAIPGLRIVQAHSVSLRPSPLRQRGARRVPENGYLLGVCTFRACCTVIRPRCRPTSQMLGRRSQACGP